MKDESKVVVWSAVLAIGVFGAGSVIDWLPANLPGAGFGRSGMGGELPLSALTALGLLAFGHFGAGLLARQKRLEHELRRYLDDLHALAAGVQAFQERERIQIAREVEDRLGQTLTALKMDLAWLRKRVPEESEGLPETMHCASNDLDRALQRVREVCIRLRPGLLEDLGLAAAVECEARTFQKRNEIAVDLEIDPTIDLSGDVGTAVFRILQETLANVARHARASRLFLGLFRSEGGIVLKVRDNGQGIDFARLEAAGSFGLVSMEERVRFFGGDFVVESLRRQGTTVTARLPVDGASRN